MGTNGTDVRGARVLVVGASSGIGREIGLRFSQLGARVGFHGRRVEKLEEAVAHAADAFAVVGDISNSSMCASIVRDAVEQLGALDLVVCSASLSALNLLQDTSADEWSRVYAANVIGPAELARLAIPSMPPGSIFAFISSESVGAPYHGLVPYGSSKAALEELVRGLRLEHPDRRFANIRVGQTLPTDFARDFSPELAAELMPKWIGLGRIPAQGMDTQELGRAIADTLAIALTTPSVEFQDMILRAPGGQLTDPSIMDRQLADTQASLRS